MKLLLDAMWPPEMACQLRERGHDVVAVVEREALRKATDRVIFGAAQAEARVLVTEDVDDYRVLALHLFVQGRSHCGLIFTDNRHLPRGRASTFGRVTTALHALLVADLDLTNREYWLS